MFSRRILNAIAAIILFLAADCHAEVLKISPKNSNNFSKVINRLNPGDVLRVEDGNYSVKVKFTVSGSEKSPITIEGSEKVFFEGSKIGKYDPVFETNGQNYLQFKNLNFRGVRAGVQADGGSHHIVIDGLRTDHCQFAVKLADASFVTVRNAFADNSRNAFRGEGETHHITFENIEAYHSQDIYKDYDKNYLNGDGFIFENRTHDLVFKNIKSGGHWDAGLDIKGSHVRMENIVSFGNKNGLKFWGQDIEISNALVYGCKAQVREDGSKVDGYGLNMRIGAAKITNATFVDNEAGNMKVKQGASVEISNSISAQKASSGAVAEKYGTLNSQNVVWYHESGEKPKWFEASMENRWEDPQFVDREKGDYRLKEGSPAAGLGYRG